MTTPGTATLGAREPATVPSAEATAPSPEGHLVGNDGCPIRAIAFSSGGFETAMQLGVTHALLVIQGKPPDAAVGISAGAISAVALAEILQAEPVQPEGAATIASQDVKANWTRTLEARVKRFREVLDGYQRAPSELLDAAKPDALQLNARLPLKPLELPIHHFWERKGRGDSLQSRAGLINLYNQLLELRMSWGTITRMVRRGLGIAAAPELRPRWKSKLAVAAEIVRTWILFGFNLIRMAPLLRPLGRPFFRSGHSKVRGKSAADLIFRSRVVRGGLRIAAAALMDVVLVAFWFGASFLIVLLIPLFLVYAIVRLGIWLGLDQTAFVGWVATHRLWVVGVLAAIVLAFFIWTYWRRDLLAFVRELRSDVVDLTLLLAAGIGVIWVVVFGSLLAANVGDQPTFGAAVLAARNASYFVTRLVILVLAAFAVVCVGVFLWLFPKDYKGRQDYTRRLLAGYDLADGLFSEHPLRQLLITTLDPGYYGSEPMDYIVDRALSDDTSPSEIPLAGKLIGDYSSPTKAFPIHVGIAVADVASGELETLNDYVTSVDGLLAATAVTPLFRPQEIDRKLYVDGSNISTDATRLVTNFLRSKVNPRSTVLHVYTVVSLPFTRAALGGPDKPYLTLVEVVRRALQLQRFRDASLERLLTELYTKIIPPKGGVRFNTKSGQQYLRTWVTPIEPERPLAVGRDLLEAPDKITRRDVISRSVADGCRAALEVMIRPSLGPYPRVLPCRTAVEKHMKARIAAESRIQIPMVELPGSDPLGGPGLAEVCKHCALQSRDAGAKDDRTIKKSIRVHPWATMGPAWPHQMETTCETTSGDPHFYAGPSEYDAKTEQALSGLAQTMEKDPIADTGRWPRARHGIPGSTRPLVTLLFSGGVFRGVYQMGVLAALSEVDIQPDIIAGASVGSITAALVAESFSHSRGTDRDGRIARLAATYLALDRLVLTDRFADFIRNFTLRAAATGFSLRQVDRFLRRYDSASASTFDSEARLVMAGLERLLYVSPFELKNLVKAFRAQDMPQATELLNRYLQEWLDRMGCGNQLLGAEPLALVITEHVLTQMAPGLPANTPIPFDAFLHRRGIYFLATATNLTRGRLEVLGEQQLIGGKRQALLLEGLLASSAFPGVFRPRWSWELMPSTVVQEQYIDGGVMDNLPLDAVAQFLFLASRGNVVAARPTTPDGKHVPHLLFSASLEKHQPPLPPEEVNLLSNNWVELSNRAKALKYNKKLQGYADAQRAVRDIWITLGAATAEAPIVPLDLEVATVIPKWLCGTFAFHPMIGFRRARQAESIAHGCASTLIALGDIVRREPRWAAGWGIRANEVPTSDYVTREDPYEAAEDSAPPNRCWLRPQIVCPFSNERLKPLGLEPQTMSEIEKIHFVCRQRKTHQPH